MKKNEIINSKVDRTALLFDNSKLYNSEIGRNSYIGEFSRVKDTTLNNYVRIDRNNLIMNSSIEDFSYTGQYDVIMHSKIGKFCSISWGVTIGAGEHDYSKISSHDFLYNKYYNLMPKDATPPYDRYSSKLIIENDVWIGAGATILRGVTLGNGCVIGANSVVTKDIPPYAIAVGSPAKIIKFRFSESIIKELLELKWWNLSPKKIKEHYSIFTEDNISNVIKKIKKIKKT